MTECFHPDAADDHGDFIGTATDFIDYAKGVHRANRRHTAHGVLNHTIELEGDTAHSETQFIVFLLKKEGGARTSPPAGTWIASSAARTASGGSRRASPPWPGPARWIPIPIYPCHPTSSSEVPGTPPISPTSVL